ncbi:unnamed protein product [Allacma fusca]|uniref:Uncharacterized protein n=1 Tax=Allacma fusca TaxID=39272 RepID=A0A8J2KG05_9HEXA|nr:unnamed protein product [Allacma fusca]
MWRKHPVLLIRILQLPPYLIDREKREKRELEMEFGVEAEQGGTFPCSYPIGGWSGSSCRTENSSMRVT